MTFKRSEYSGNNSGLAGATLSCSNNKPGYISLHNLTFNDIIIKTVESVIILNVAICDNEINICNYIETLINQIVPVANIKTFNSKNALLNSAEEFSIYILDIKGVDGLNIARSLRSRSSKSVIIFLTGYRDYMEEAFDVNAFHYLIKPIAPERFKKIFTRALNEVNQSEKKIIIKSNNLQHVINLNDIIFVESSNKKIILHTTDNVYEVYSTMEQIEKQLENNFYRCHRCYLVNLTKILAYNSQLIKLINGEEILIAQKKYHEFVKNFLRFVKW